MGVEYAVSLGRKEFHAIGFIPKPRLEEYDLRGQLWMQYENGEPCGFLVWGNGFPILKIYQVCIQYDARRRQSAMDLVQRLITKARGENYEGISLWCAEDLEANAFWKACGFSHVMTREGGKDRGRKHNGWFLPIQSYQLFIFDQSGAKSHG